MTIVVGPVFPYRAGIAYCTTRLAEELSADVISFSRQFPKMLYPGGSDIDESLRAKTPERARFLLDIVNPFSWIRTALLLRRERPEAVILVWWVWVWALPYLTLLLFLPRATRVILQCHNIGDKEPAAWKCWLTNRVLRRGDVLVVHARSEAEEAERRVGAAPLEWKGTATAGPVIPSVARELAGGRRETAGAETGRTTGRAGHESTVTHRPPAQVPRCARDDTSFADPHEATHCKPSIVTTFLPVHELGGQVPSRADARAQLGVQGNVALFFGHVRPFKGLDIALHAWPLLTTDVTLIVAGEAWWKGEEEYRALARGLTNVRLEFRFIPDSEIATYFAAADVVLAPYRIEAQSGVALTAFHFARPVIATTVGGLPEIIEEGSNGMLVPPDDPVALAAAVDAFFARTDRETMEAQAAASARRYSWQEYGALFSRLVRGE